MASLAIRSLVVALFIVAGAASAGRASAASGEASGAAFVTAMNEATKAVGDDTLFDTRMTELLKFFPQLPGGYYIVDGDIRMTEAGIRQMVKDRAKALKAEAPLPDTAKAGELIVNTKDGSITCYRKKDERRLTFAVDKASFDAAPQPGAYSNIRKEVATAARNWVDSCAECGISFVEIDKPSPVEGDAFFIVRYIGVQSSLIAQAFFPDDDVSLRYLDIAKPYYTSSYDKIGVLRHELGHVLGYRHEQNRPETPVQCNFSAEDGNWAPIDNVPYTPKSVMHYPCTVDGVQLAGSKTFQLQATDVSGHRTMYRDICKP